MIPQLKGVCDPFFGSIPHDDLFNDPIKASSIPEATKSFEPGETLFCPGDGSDLIYILHQGQADICVVDIRHQKTLSNSVEPERMYGVIEAVSGGKMWYTMATRTKCTFSVMRRDTFLAGLSRDPALCYRLAQILSRMNREILSVAAST